MASDKTFGDLFRERRMKTGLTLREFCQKHGLDPGNLSRLERGLAAPPENREKLQEHAKHLGLKKESDEWYHFFDLAAAEVGRIPDDVLTDKELVAKLPLLFRTLRGRRVPEAKLSDLINHIRGK